MKKIILDDNLFEIFPNAEVRYFCIYGIDNTLDDFKKVQLSKILKEAKIKALKHIECEPFSSNLVIKQWREIFQQFKKKKGACSSIEALLKRVSQDREFLPINPLVDLYNSISLEFGVPCGSEDLDLIDKDMHLGVSNGGDEFWPLGGDKNDPTLPGEICYYDNKGAICRCWNYREAQRTMLSENTKNAVVVIENALKEQSDISQNAIKKLWDISKEYFGVLPSDIVLLNKDLKEGIMME